jgi:cell division septation protein DedD
MAAPAAPPGVDTAERFVIHLTSFKLAAEAEMEVSALRRRGIEARSIQADIPDRGTWYRIVTGNFATFAEAESVALRLQAEGKVPYAHIAADGGRGQPVPVGTLDRARP